MTEPLSREEKTQRSVDSFYLNGGKRPCCAGCDWWRFHNSVSGECTRNAPVSGAERWAMTGMSGITGGLPAGHIMTTREHSCGDFIDTHEW